MVVDLHTYLFYPMDTGKRCVQCSAVGAESKSSGTKKWSGRLVECDKSWSKVDRVRPRPHQRTRLFLIALVHRHLHPTCLRFSSLYIFLRLYNRCTLRRLICGVGFSEELVKVPSCAVLPLFW